MATFATSSALHPTEGPNPARCLNQRYWLALAAIASLIVIHELLVQPALSGLSGSAPVINIAGRQRMLSQKLSKAALALVETDESANRDPRARELVVTRREWRAANSALQHGDAESGLPAPNTPEIELALIHLQPHVEAISAAVEELLEWHRLGSLRENHERSKLALQRILSHEPVFLDQMERIVGLYESQARSRVRELQILGLTIMGALLCTLLAVQLRVIRPAVDFVGKEFANSEAAYRQLVESMNDGLVLHDNSGHIEFANSRFESLLAHSPGSLVGRALETFLEAGDIERFKAMLRESSGVAGPVEFRFLKVDGMPVDALVSPRRLPALNEDTPGWLLVIVDITSKKREETRQRELMSCMAHADRLRSMGEMATNLAHEINQPLGAIANFAEGAIQEIRLTGESASHLERPLRGILKAALRGAEIIRRMRGFSQKQSQIAAAVSVNDLIVDVEQMMAAEARSKGVIVRLCLQADLPEISIDEVQLQQVLTNLLQNAISVMEESGSAMRLVEIESQSSDGQWMQISVKDTGPGIPSDAFEKLFEPFFTTRRRGTGMGLAIARGIIEACGGTIDIDRHVRTGACFRILLPLGPDAHACDTRAAAAREFAHV